MAKVLKQLFCLEKLYLQRKSSFSPFLIKIWLISRILCCLLLSSALYQGIFILNCSLLGHTIIHTNTGWLWFLFKANWQGRKHKLAIKFIETKSKYSSHGFYITQSLIC